MMMFRLTVLFVVLWGGLPAQKTGTEVTFAEEFDGTALDLTRWSPHAPSGGRLAGELALAAPDAILVSGGQAHITARRQAGDLPFVSGVITTRGTFSQQYGRFEIRFRVPEGRGLEARFQLLPVSLKTLPSIDVVDVLGAEPGIARFENRWGDDRTERAFGDTWAGPTFDVGFHTITLEWSAERLVWLVDGKKRFESMEGVPQEPMFLSLSLEVGSRRAKVPGTEVKFPAAFDIDSIRVYRLP